MSLARLDINQADLKKGQVASQLKQLVDDACKAVKTLTLEVHYFLTVKPGQSEEEAEMVDDEFHAAVSKDKRIVKLIPHMGNDVNLGDQVAEDSFSMLLALVGKFANSPKNQKSAEDASYGSQPKLK